MFNRLPYRKHSPPRERSSRFQLGSLPLQQKSTHKKVSCTLPSWSALGGKWSSGKDLHPFPRPVWEQSGAGVLRSPNTHQTSLDSWQEHCPVLPHSSPIMGAEQRSSHSFPPAHSPDWGPLYGEWAGGFTPLLPLLCFCRPGFRQI